MPKKRPIADQPYVENYPPLRDWLRQHEARCQWQLRLGGTEDEPAGYVECYFIPGAKCEVVVTVLAHKHGWNIFTPYRGNQVTETLADAELRLGITLAPPTPPVPEPSS